MAISFYWDDGTLVYDGDEPSSAAEAWEITMQKWQRIRDYLEAGEKVENPGGCDTCGLCMFYGARVDWLLDCEQCPIGMSGHVACDGTPYITFMFAIVNNELDEARHAVYREIEFLERIRDGNQKNGKGIRH